MRDSGRPVPEDESVDRFDDDQDDEPERPEVLDRLRTQVREGTPTLLFSARDPRHADAPVLREPIDR